jgi:hypothetical protein
LETGLRDECDYGTQHPSSVRPTKRDEYKKRYNYARRFRKKRKS